MGKFIDNFNQDILNKDAKEYKRELYQTYLTGPEWRNVEMVAEYAQFLKEGNSMFQFPYFRQIAELWKVMYRSYNSARAHQSISDIVFSEYMLMDLFVVFFTTMEMLPKALVSLLVFPFLSANNNTTMQSHLAEFYKTYAEKLETVPFYDHDYSTLRKALAKKYTQCTDRTWGDWFSWTCISIELRFKKWLSIPLRYMFHEENSAGTPGTTDILVKYKDEDAALAAERFKNKLADIAQRHHVALVGEERIKDQKEGKDVTSVYARLRVPRYMAFLPLVKELADNNIAVRKIAGQDLVQVKCEITVTDDTIGQDNAISDCADILQTQSKAKQLYSYSDRIHSNYKVCLFEVPVKDLGKTVHDLEYHQDDGIEARVKFIHNF